MTLFKRLPESWQYVLLRVVLWIVVDWGTVGLSWRCRLDML
ncbi:MAG TPA: hypothetical protein PK373_03125 [Sedimentisphaerales bacterium]|nr:hypothetical protein [Sedimentisphaerales bacterium]HQG48056.1 hypothetical protein [Sedimentisphaerales bacterium]HQI27506.1 hypothetical protein [Sedimentisphaerales bacterium]